MKHLLMWFYMMSKRLYRKIAFLAILVLIPLLVLGYSTVGAQDSGVVTIALAQEGEDTIARELIGQLQAEDSLIRYVYCDSPERAKAMVQAGKADGAWIFPAQLAQKINAYAEDPSRDNAFVTVLQREDSVALMMTREKLSGLVFRYCAKAVYLSYIRQNIPGMEHLSDAELLEYYESTGLSEDIFAFTDTSGGENALNTQTHYLLTPLRGLLAVVIVLCGLATAMFYMQDSARGMFAWVRSSRRIFVELGYQLVSVVNMGAVALLSLWLAGLTAGLWTELSALALFSLCTALFCMVLRRLCGGVKVLGTVIPLLMVAMLLICPIFLDLGFLRQVQLLFPPTYYINSVHNSAYLLYMPVYILCAAGLNLLVDLFQGRKRR